MDHQATHAATPRVRRVPRYLLCAVTGLVWLTGAPIARGAMPGFRERLAETLAMSRLRDTTLLAMSEAYRRMVATLEPNSPEFAGAVLYYQALVMMELGDRDGAQTRFERCASLPCVNAELPRRAAVWSHALQTGQLPNPLNDGDASWILRIRLQVLDEPPAVAPAEIGDDLDGVDHWLWKDLSGKEPAEILASFEPSEILTVPDPEGRPDYDTIYRLYDPAWLTIGLLTRIHRLRKEPPVPVLEERVQEPWCLVLSPRRNQRQLTALARAPLESGPEHPAGQKEYLALQQVAAERSGDVATAARLTAALQRSGIDTADVWVLRALSLNQAGLVELLPTATGAVMTESAGDPFAPQLCRPRQRGDFPGVAARIGFYQEIGWSFRSRMLTTDGFSLQLPAGQDALRAHEVLRSVGSLAGRVDDSPHLSAVMRWECQLRTGDWELFQNEVTGDFLKDFPEGKLLLEAARFVAGRLRAGDGTTTASPLPGRETERHSEIATHLLTGLAGGESDVRRPLAMKDRAPGGVPAAPPPPQQRWWHVVLPVAGMLVLGSVLLWRFRRTVKGGSHVE